MTPADQNPEKVLLRADGRVSDAIKSNWVDNYCPEWSKPFLRLSRLDRPIGTWLLLIPCWWGLLLAIIDDGGSLIDLDTIWIASVCFFGAFLMRGAGCTWNDITDRNLDGKVARSKSRPLPAGLITVKLAVIWMLLQGDLGFAPIFLYLSGICWTLFYDTIYAHQDKEDDILIGIKSTALRLGDNTYSWLYGFVIGLVFFNLLCLLCVYFKISDFVSLLFCIFGILIMTFHLLIQIKKLDINDPEKCLIIFRSNRDSGLILVAILCIAVLV